MAYNTKVGRQEFTATSGQTAFQFNFKIFATSDIEVIQNGVVLTETTHYTVAINGDNGGTVTLVTGATLNDAVILQRDLPITRTTDYQSGGDLLENTLDDDQDYQTYLTADKDRELSHYLKVPDSLTGFDNELETPLPLQVLRYNADASKIESQTIGGDEVYLNIANVNTIAELPTSPTIETYNVRGYLAANDGGGGVFNYDAAENRANANGGTIIDATGTGVGLGCWIRQYSGSVKTTWFGAQEDKTTDDLTAIQAAIDYATTLDGIVVVEGNGGTSKVTGTVDVKNEVIYKNSSLYYATAAGSLAIVKMGDPNGDSLIRPAGIENVHVEVATTQTDITGFRIDNYVRSSWVKDCTAKMQGELDASNSHIGFEILSNRIAVTTNAGTYQNTIENCTAFFASTGFRASTRGTQAEAETDPQANGNYIKNCFAYSCRQRAIDLGYGSQENICEIRADTFPSQIGLGTTVIVGNIDGRYNKLQLIEEIGSVGDTQYTIRIGDTAIYNEIEYSTQQVVTGKIDDSSTVAGRREKNIIKQIGNGLIAHGRPGSETSDGDYFTLSASQTQAISEKWIAPAKCVVTKVMGVLNAAAPTGGDTRLYFAKNASFATNNRLVWTAGEAVTVKSITTDASASVDIGAQWVLDADDVLTIAGDTPSGGGATFTATFFVRFV